MEWICYHWRQLETLEIDVEYDGRIPMTEDGKRRPPSHDIDIPLIFQHVHTISLHCPSIESLAHVLASLMRPSITPLTDLRLFRMSVKGIGSPKPLVRLMMILRSYESLSSLMLHQLQALDPDNGRAFALLPPSLTSLSITPNAMLLRGLSAMVTAKCMPYITRLNLSTHDVSLRGGPTFVSLDDIKLLAPLTSLQHLSCDFPLKCGDIMDAIISQWSMTLTSLVTLVTIFSGQPSPLINALPQLKALKRLVVWGTLTNDHLSIISNGCQLLTHFTFSWSAGEHDINILQPMYDRHVNIIRHTRGYICRRCLIDTIERCMCLTDSNSV
jgi:hypothetical protein